MKGKMQAFRIVAPLTMELQEIDIPDLKPYEVLVKVIATGVCTTDVELYDGSMSYYRDGLSKMPLTAGHEWSGTVAELGSAVKGFEIGDLVVGDISIGCGTCMNCKKGKYHLCSDRTELGVIRYDGSMAEYLKTDGKNIYKVPAGVTAEQAALVEPLATVLYAARRTGIDPGDHVVVFGDGPIGLLNAQLANCCGAGKVAVVARKELHRDLIEKKWGMKLINSNDGDIHEALKDYFGDYPDVVFEDTGNPEVINTAARVTAPGGKLCAVSLTGRDTVPFCLEYITSRDITLYGVLASPNSFAPALNMMASGKIDVESCISHRFGFEQTPEALEFARNSHGQGRIKILIKKE
ncbi:MAG TPA: alcohol dehydrogenase catalytic domain-containing protein [Anaerovoracaceae bacterium]|nr:alcohol dehydrogenase catalytic domain-containing protein [Anaerovoracaceae bacterium]